MAALNFPSSPTDGQVHTENGKTWSWNAATTSWVSSNTTDVVSNIFNPFLLAGM